MPGHVALEKRAQRMQNLRVLVTEDAEELLRVHNCIICDLFQRLFQSDLVAPSVVVDQARLFATVVEFTGSNTVGVLAPTWHLQQRAKETYLI